ncbi:helix-turn-helix transcriptional regulator [Litoreibacter roseus]|uniref:HTH luxR-type domain-containing protein n=1 Tax=Litoreibacter roseus TaxID=2601869 RepID=A0A6N6JLU5_9RHOB|nr:LuxR family transcriptional regulator [Litoreibacter roseus]GFE67283.1 hypothetical protein KIN_43570 [Litoreibacter roseus]
MFSLDDTLLPMAKSKDIETVWSTHGRAMRALGFDRMVYGFTRFPIHGRNIGVGEVNDALVLSNHSPDYMEYFVGKRMYLHGPMTRWASENEGTCSWRMIAQMAEAQTLSADELEVIQINQRFAVTAGYTISFHSGTDTTKAAIGLAARRGLSQDDVEQIWAAHHAFIELSSYLMHLQVSRLPHKSGLIHRLSQRQQEVLQWAAQGKTGDEMAQIMGLTRATVEKHLRLARAALNSTTTAHAVMKASSANLFLSMKP